MIPALGNRGVVDLFSDALMTETINYLRNSLRLLETKEKGLLICHIREPIMVDKNDVM